MNKNLFSTIILLLFTLTSYAINMSDSNFVDSAKFVVVVSVLSTILAGIFFLLIYLERKISNLEKKIK